MKSASRPRVNCSKTGMLITEIAASLGYAETSAFTRAFRRWSGATPRSDGEGLRWCRTLKHAAAPTYDPHPKRTPPAGTLPWSLKTRAGHAKVLDAGGGGRTRTELSLQRILSPSPP